MIKKLIIIACMITFLSSNSQVDFTYNYTPILSQGKLPAELNQTATVLSQNLVNQLSIKDNPEYLIQKLFYTSTTFSEDKLLKYGRVLYNTVVNDYLNKICDLLLKNQPEIRKKIVLYPISINAANAWAYDNGHIYVSLDYIARYTTEAQIAMVLSHEISHSLNKHHYQRFVKRAEVIKKLNSNQHKDTIWKKERDFYKMQESQADMEGFELLKNSGYSTSSIPAQFDLMLLSDFSFENITFETNYFNSGHFTINPRVFYKEIKPIRIESNYDDTWDTHPNIYKRKKAIEENITSTKPPAGKDFLVGESEFNFIRDVCRFETIIANVQDFDLTSAVYHSFCLLKKYPKNAFLQNTISNSLYQLAVYKSYKKLYAGFYDYMHVKDDYKSNANRDSTMGHISQLKKLFNRLDGEDLVLLAITNNYKAYKANNYSEISYKAKLDTLFDVLRNIHNFNYKDFYKNEQEYNKRTIYVSDTSTKNRNFVDAIERKSAFVDYMPDKQFVSFFKDTISSNEFGIKYIAKGRMKNPNLSKSKRNESEIEDRKHVQFNKKELVLLTKVLIQEPRFNKMFHKKYNIESFPIEAATKGSYFKTELLKELNKVQISAIPLNDAEFQETDIDKYNDISLINRIMDESSEHFETPSVGVFSAKSNGKIIAKYNTPYVLRITLSEDIYDDVAFYFYGYHGSGKIVKDLSYIDYTFTIINIESGQTVYSRKISASRTVNEKEMRELIQEELQNINSLKHN